MSGLTPHLNRRPVHRYWMASTIQFGQRRQEVFNPLIYLVAPSQCSTIFLSLMRNVSNVYLS
jgi:hypothetical protein